MKRTKDRICVGAVLIRGRDRRSGKPSLVLLGKRNAECTLYPDVLGGPGSLILNLHVVTEWIGVPRNRSPAEHSEASRFAAEDTCRLALAHPDYLGMLR